MIKNLAFCIFAFIFIYLIYLFTVILRKKKLEKFKGNAYVRYLEIIYHIDVNKINIRGLANIIALTNAFIIALTLFVIITITESFIIMFLFALVILIPLQLLFYHIIGKIYQKKGSNKNV